MSSAIATIADAVVAELNSGTFTPTFQAQRYYRPLFDLAELKTLGDNPMTAAQIASRQGHNKIAEKINKASKGLDEKSQSWQETLQHLDKQLSTPAGRAKFEANNVAEYWRRFDMGG